MKVFESLSEVRAHNRIRSLALGFFDGVHVGHQQVIKNSMANLPADECCVLTFKVHPQSVLFPSQAPALLTGLPHKLKILGAYGIQNVLTLPFDRETMQTTAEDFLQNLQHAFPRLERVSVGPNWRFGHKRSGDIPMLSKWCQQLNIQPVLSEAAAYDGIIISSSRIRSEIVQGRLLHASNMLGHSWSLYGTVTKGRQLGRTLGFPTLNLMTEDQCLPPHGVYAGFVDTDTRSRIPSAINIGYRPTVTDDKCTIVEAHLLDFSGDLYGQSVNVSPVLFLRSEQAFNSHENLRRQIERDVNAVRTWANTSHR